ncbi:hypothetical protein [uncultured Variovorax sp.]|uniref:hypothetical protein n=1 Tax=uncultured Variovorax sp. TaxID=114708 RepID=UPI002623EA19|nr:hypothetical protein [uncultured Variovorax sp.]
MSFHATEKTGDPIIQKLRNLSLHLQGALANRIEEGDTDAANWLTDGVCAIRIAIDAIGLCNITDALWRDAEDDNERLRGVLHEIHSQYIVNRGDMTDAEALNAIRLLACAEEKPEGSEVPPAEADGVPRTHPSAGTALI